MRVRFAAMAMTSLAGIAVLTAAGTMAVSGATQFFKCWTNKDGVKECGNAVPPEYAQTGHTAYNQKGLTVGQQARAKSPEQFAEEQRQLEARKAEELARKERDLQDRILLQTFTTEDDLLLARNGRLSEIGGQIKLTESRTQKLQTNLDQLVKSAADFERAGKPLPERLDTDIRSVRQQITDNDSFIDRKRQESAAISQKFDADLQRWRELKANR